MRTQDITIYRGYRYRLYPTEVQKVQLGKIFSTVHFVYNSLRECWLEDSRLDFQCELPRLIEREPWLNVIQRSILDNTARQLEQACRRCEENTGRQETQQSRHGICSNGKPQSRQENFSDGKLPKKSTGMDRTRNIPRKKLKNDAYSSFTLSGHNIRIRDGKMILGSQQGIGPVKLVESRPIPESARIISVTVSRNSSGHYYASFVCQIRMNTGRSRRESGPVPDARISKDDDSGMKARNAGAHANFHIGIRAVGLDFSLQNFFVASDPDLVPDQNYLHRAKSGQKRMADESRKLAHMKYMSRNFQKQRRRIAGLHERTANQRRDYLQKLSTRIADEYDVVCVETLDLIEMEQSKHSYARKVADSGWANFVQMLDYKLRERGKPLVHVDKWYASSRICHECRYVNHDLKVSDREWVCPVCGTKHDRDRNASLNIRDEGLRILWNKRRNGGYSAARPTGALSDTQTTYRIGTSSEEVMPEADNQMSQFWGQGPYGWEYRGCAWDSQFYVSMMDRNDPDYGEDDIKGMMPDERDFERREKGDRKDDRYFYVREDNDDSQNTWRHDAWEQARRRYN